MLHFPYYGLDFFRLPIEFSQIVWKYDLCFLHELDATHDIVSLQHDKTKSELALSSDDILRSKLNLKEDQYILEMLMCLLIVDVKLRVLVVFDVFEVFLNDEILPDLDDLLIESLCLLYLPLFLEELTHIVVAAAYVNALRAVFETLQVYALW